MVREYTNPSSTLCQANAVALMGLHGFSIPGFISMSNIALRKFGGNTIRVLVPYERTVDFLQTTENIDYARSLIVVIKWDAMSGHMVVISGNSFANGLKVIDPWENSRTIYAPYPLALSGSQFETWCGNTQPVFILGDQRGIRI